MNNFQEQRLHPLTLLYRLVTALPQVLLPVLFILYQGSSTEDIVYIILAIFIGVFTLPVILLSYYYFTYTITPKEIIIKSGILSKKERHIKISRVQNVSISQNFIHKILRIAKVQLETAGDANTEGLLDSVSLAESEKIRQIIKDFQAESYNEEDDYSKNKEPLSNLESESENVLFSMNLKDTIKYGSIRFRPIVLGISAWLFSIFSQFNPDWTQELEGILESGYKNYIKQLDIFEIVFFVILSVISILFFSWILDILLTVNTYYKFKLVSQRNKLLTSQGLFSTKKGAIPLKKLQMMVLKSNPITRKLNYYRLELETAGFGGGNQQKNAETAIPIAKLNKIKEIINKIRNVNLPDKFQKVSPKTIRRAAIRYFIISIPIMVGLYFAIGWILALVIVIPVIIIGAILRYQYRGYYVEENQVFVKQGFWFQRISIIPIEKIQTLHVRRSFFQRRLNLATLYIDTAATSNISDASIIDIDFETSMEIFKELNELFRFKKNTKL